MDFKELKNKKLYLLDMDGTIYIGNKLFPYSSPFLKEIKNREGEYIFLTNNSSKSVEDYVEKLKGFGIQADPSNFLTASQTTGRYIRHHYRDKKIYVLGTRSLKKEFASLNISMTDHYQEDIDCLVVGYDTELTYQKLVDACRLLVKGVDFIATNPDWVCPTSFGYVPDCGSICQMLQTATGREPKYIGKPSPRMAELAIENSKFTAEETLVIGDRLYTDIACGIHAGVTTALVLSGETKEEDLQHSPWRPNYVFRDIGEIRDILVDL